ncbi:lamin tail domain-containing protein [soil metagenome]
MLPSRSLPALLALLLGIAAAAAGLVGVSPPTAADDPAPRLFVSEIDPDNVGYDNFEFFEVTNTTAAAVDLAAAGIGFHYVFADNDDRTRDVALTVPGGTVVPAGGSTVFWLQYATSTVDTSAFSEADFRAHFGASSDVPVVRVTGQAGMANGGDRGIRVVDSTDASISWSFYAAGSVSGDQDAHFRVPATGPSAEPFSTLALPTPGVIDPAQLTPGSGPVDPGPTVPEQGPPPSTDPDLVTAPLQITEVTPDTSNVGSADGFEFVEVYNATDEPIDFDDYTISYLYPLPDLTSSSTALWPATPGDPVIEPGHTLVLWVKNGQNDELTDADFNAEWGSHLTLGTDLVEMHVAGMANGSARGLQVQTNTGYVVSRAYYNLVDKDVVTSQGLQYAVDPADTTKQTLLGSDQATPGYAAPAQVPDHLMHEPADTTAPTILDTSDTSVAGTDNDVPLVFTVRDDAQVRTVRLSLTNDVEGQAPTRSLTFGSPDQYSYSIPAVDLIGKRWFEYTVTASDGTSTTTYGPIHVDLDSTPTDRLRLNVRDDQVVGGSTRIAATTTGDLADLGLSIDGAPADPLVPSLEKSPVFAFEAAATNVFFRNGVLMGEEVLAIFDDGIPTGYQTITAAVPLANITQGDPVTVSVYAGTKAGPVIDPDENNDDFSIKNLRLVLPDGRVLRPAGYEDPDRVLAMGDSAGKNDFVDAPFTLPDDAYTSLANTWDTTAAADGAHVIAAISGADEVSRTVVVDNTAPSLTTDLEDGRHYRGDFVIDATATDAGSGVGSLVAALDGEPVDLPYATSSVDLPPGEHTVTFTAADQLGNTTEQTVGFSTADEQPSADLVSPSDGAEVDGDEVELGATVADPEADPLEVSFREGYTFVPTDDAVHAFAGTTRVADSVDRSGSTALSGDDLAALSSVDGLDIEVSSDDEFPYELFTVDVPADAGADAEARIAWSGSANADAKVLLYVLDTATDAWEEVDRYVTTGGAPTDFELGAQVPLADHVEDGVDKGAGGGVVTVLVQHSEGFAGPVQSTRADPVAPYSAHGVTPRSDYDFTFGWETDTQYYNATDDYYGHQQDIHNFFLGQRENLNLQYVMHTGDIVDDASDEHQWRNADAAYQLLDDAQLPYGVLAGNHDVGHKSDDYTKYAEYFGAHRYEDNAWYGESYEDNRGHYDLISAGGLDFMIVSMGWDPGTDELAWMNDVIRAHPERKVMIDLHEYILTTGGMGPVPQRLMREVVATNPNVFAVSSGHYHDAFTRIDRFDDDGDGVAERAVYDMLFDYQGLPEGGLGYLRLMHFDNVGGQIVVRTYSPSIDDFDSDDPTLDLPNQEFSVPYAEVGLVPRTKTLATDSFHADVLTATTVGDPADSAQVTSGATATTTWTGLSAGEHGWFVRTANPFGGLDYSAVRTFTASGPADVLPASTIGGVAQVGHRVRVRPGSWPDDADLTFQWLVGNHAVAGETRATYLVRPRDARRGLRVRVTGAMAGESIGSTRSAPVRVAPGMIDGRRPQLGGRTRVGGRLVARLGHWEPDGLSFRFRWLADSHVIRGANDRRLVLRAGQRGHRISVRVIATRPGYAVERVTSRPSAPVRG